LVSPSAAPPADPCWLMTRRPATTTLMAALPASTKTSPAAAPVRPRPNPLAPARRGHGPLPRRLRLRRRPAPRRWDTSADAAATAGQRPVGASRCTCTAKKDTNTRSCPLAPSRAYPKTHSTAPPASTSATPRP